jgi:hypothetical protein
MRGQSVRPAMWAQPPPTEWVAGRSRIGYWAGLYGGAIGLYLVGGAIYILAADSMGPTLTLRTAVFLAQLQGIEWLGIVCYFVLYLLLRAMPLGTVEISPAGLFVNMGGLHTFFPWSRVHRMGRYLYTFSGRWGFANRYVMSPRQGERISLFLPT